MLNDDEQSLFEDTKVHVADAISTLIDGGHHPELIYATMLSEISSRITEKDFWGDERPSCLDFQGYWKVTWRLQEKAFADLEGTAPAPSL